MHRSTKVDHLEYFLPSTICPPGILQPTQPPRLLHLDVAHWIHFGRLGQGKDEPVWATLLQLLRARVTQRDVRVVLSGSQYRELIRIKDPAQRRALAYVVEELSQFTYLTRHVDVMRHEVNAALKAITDTPGIGWEQYRSSRGSALNVMGRSGGLRIMEGVMDGRSGIDRVWSLIDSQ